MTRVFLSYRRGDTQDVTGRIYDRLVSYFGKGAVFMDVDSIPVGIDYRIYLSDWISHCDVVVVVIGVGWLAAVRPQRNTTSKSTTQRRIDDAGDFVRIEVAAALARGIPVIPLFVNGATALNSADLPEDIADLAFRNGLELRSGHDFHTHVDRLIAGVERAIGTLEAGTKDSAHPKPAVAASVAMAKSTLDCANVPSVSWPTNLGFEDGEYEGMPVGWCNGLYNVDGVSTFPLKVVVRDGGRGRCVRIRKVRGDVRAFGTVMQRCSATAFRAKAMRLEADLKCERLQRWACLWLRIDGPSGDVFFDRRLIRGNEPWGRQRIDTRVPDDALWLNYGVLLVGNGTVWADDFALTVDPGAEVFMIDFGSIPERNPHG